MPYSLGKDYNVRCIVTKVLIAIQSMKDTTLATHHAACQILYRLRYLLCLDTAAVVLAMKRFKQWQKRYNILTGKTSSAYMVDDKNDYHIMDRQLVCTIRDMLIPDRVRSGASPRPDIFNRPIVCIPMHHHSLSSDVKYPIDDKASKASNTKVYYDSVLQAVFDFSFGSTKIRHLNESTIDDIAIGKFILFMAI